MSRQTKPRGWTLNSETRGRSARHLLVSAIMFALVLPAAEAAETNNYSEKVLYSFGYGDTYLPQGPLLRDDQGNLYGTSEGGYYNQGAVFELDATNTLTVLYSFTGTDGDGAEPYGPLARDAAGNLYGTTLDGGAGCELCGTVFKLAPPVSPSTTWTETVLYSFTGTAGDGKQPEGGVVLGSGGNLYGTTFIGGTYGLGTVFKVDKTRHETVLYSFTASNGDGAGPTSGLIRDAEGNLYGTTVGGGNCFAGGTCYGTVFMVDAKGNETVLYAFTGTDGDGLWPVAGVVRDEQGNLYGTTPDGGDFTCNPYPTPPSFGCGIVFKLDSTGQETVLHTFTGIGGDGEAPIGGLVRDDRGNLYGTTVWGGDLMSNGGSGYGTAFEVAATGKEATLHSFTGTPTGDGAAPFAALVKGPNGSLYGTTIDGGAVGLGTVFELPPRW